MAAGIGPADPVPSRGRVFCACVAPVPAALIAQAPARFGARGNTAAAFHDPATALALSKEPPPMHRSLVPCAAPGPFLPGGLSSHAGGAMRRVAVLLLGVLAATGAAEAADRTVSGLKNPESVVVGPGGRLYVSEIGEFGTDGDGRILVIEGGGTPRPFASGLDDPKGLALRQGTLYVADKTRVMKVGPDGRTSVFAAADAFPQPPKFLNDVAFDPAGDLYVSDSGDIERGGGGAIFRIAPDGRVSTVVTQADDPAFASPNGLLFERGGKLLVLDFSTGQLLRLDTATKRSEKLAEGFGGGDGLAMDAAGTLYLSDWKGGRTWKLDLRRPGATPEPYAASYQAAADLALSADGRDVLVPDMKAGTLRWMRK
jgi:gluconolactonase